jgi:sugar (pentulose or hexulose) kinase
LGIDIGTSGIRASVVQRLNGKTSHPLISAAVSFVAPSEHSNPLCVQQSPQHWLEALDELLKDPVLKNYLNQVAHIVLDATSSSVLLCNADFSPRTPALMYNDQQAQIQSTKINELTHSLGVTTGALGASSTLAKVRFLQTTLVNVSQSDDYGDASEHVVLPSTLYICHQIDYINHFLADFGWLTDENNALKLGYDSIQATWPTWVGDFLNAPQDQATQNPTIILPNVVAPGSPLGLIKPPIAKRYGFAVNAILYAGTTDSIAGFLAAGATQLGDAVTSLGSTLALKIWSDRPIFNAQHGIYSHRLKDKWLVGGASNSGGAVLLAYFSLAEMTRLTQQFNALTAAQQTTLLQQVAHNNDYPLVKPGERFPIANSNFKPKMPAPPSFQAHSSNSPQGEYAQLQYFIAMVQGVVNVEKLAYDKLQALGAPPVKRLYAVGGGLKNSIWQRLRLQALTVASTTKLMPAQSVDAAYGVTHLIEL